MTAFIGDPTLDINPKYFLKALLPEYWIWDLVYYCVQNDEFCWTDDECCSEECKKGFLGIFGNKCIPAPKCKNTDKECGTDLCEDCTAKKPVSLRCNFFWENKNSVYGRKFKCKDTECKTNFFRGVVEKCSYYCKSGKCMNCKEKDSKCSGDNQCCSGKCKKGFLGIFGNKCK